jgi:hypothetical protein
VYEGTLRCLHRFESQSLLIVIGSKNAELSLVGLREFLVFREEGEGGGGVRDVVVEVGCGVDVQCRRQLGVALKLEAFVVAV